MTNQHPITPPPELVEKWYQIIPNDSISWQQELATEAARWGADQELEACVEWLGDASVVYDNNSYLHPGSYLRDARRPKPPSLKEQALAALEQVEADFNTGSFGDTIRRALEALDDN